MSKLLRPVILTEEGPHISRFGLDFMKSESISQKVITWALEFGINYFDCSNLDNQTLLAKEILGIARDQLFIATKFPENSPNNILQFCQESLKNLGLNYIDLYYQGQVDPNLSVEDILKPLIQLKNEGKIRCIGLSEVSAETLRKAYAIYPITSLHVDYSLWNRDIERNDLLCTCKQLGIPIIASNPLGVGFLTGEIKKPEDLPDWMKNNPKFKGENFQKCLSLVEEIKNVATSRKVTPAQITLAWIFSKGENIIPIFSIPNPILIQEYIASLSITLTQEEINKLENVLTVSEERFE